MPRRPTRVLAVQSLENRRLLATYYVDSVNGSDANSGISESEAWSSLNRVTSTNLAPGDQVLLSRGSVWSDALLLEEPGTESQPITFRSYGDGDAPVFSRLTVDAGYYQFDGLVVDHNKSTGDAVRIRNAHDVVLRNMVVRNGTGDGIDVTNADGLLIDGLLIHHFLAGSFDTQADAHGIVASATRGITIRNTEIHHVSGDSFQADPNRASKVTTDILIEKSHFWTGPLAENFNSQWFAGQRPGENAIDTKVAKSNWDQFDRMQITVRDVVAHGWSADGFISNRAVFNMKEKVEANFDGVTVYDSEIAFRLRGSRGNANTTIKNAVLYDLDKAIRAEDDLANLTVLHTTFGNDISTQIQFAGGSGGRGTWEFKNNAFVGVKPSDASDVSNKTVAASAFVDVASNNYRLSDDSTLRDSVDTITVVSVDREGNRRPQGEKADAGAFEYVVAPKVQEIQINDGASQRSRIDDITIVFDSIVQIDPASPFQLRNKETGKLVSTSEFATESNGLTEVRLEFVTGDHVDANGSLLDGTYELTILATGISASDKFLDGDGNGLGGDDFVFGNDASDQFFRKFGDSDGNGLVNLADFGAFRSTFGKTISDAGFNPSLDGNGDGAVNLADFGMFRANFGT